MIKIKRIKNMKEYLIAAEDYLTNLLNNPHSLVNICYDKKSFGSTNPTLVRQAIRKERRWLKTLKIK